MRYIFPSLMFLEGMLWLALQPNQKHLSRDLMDGEELPIQVRSQRGDV